MKKSIYLLSVALILLGCSTEWNMELWEQKIEGSNLSVYKFYAWGGFDTTVSGLKIKDSSIGFTQEDVLKGDGFSAFKTIPNKDLIKVIKTVRPPKGVPNSNVPISTENFVIEGININQKSYLYDGSVKEKCTLQAYNFHRFEETRDSLIFFDNESQFVGWKGKDRISIPKGNVYLMTSIDNEYVIRIVYEDILIFEDLTISGGIEICRRTNFFNPIDSIRVSEFSDYGIYKPVKKKLLSTAPTQ